MLARRRLSLSLSPTIPPSFLVIVISSIVIILPLASSSLFPLASSFPASLDFFLLVVIDSACTLHRVLVCSRHTSPRDQRRSTWRVPLRPRCAWHVWLHHSGARHQVRFSRR
ncbi:hypothetical protein BDY19DRAFT_924044 [Irpex rosettiformis]|uniref:Uncharacterized protein n=1 Tax=Irpex rosettiformis TaxID=378272 RepID=A0ACB8UDS9_9APHY|nr:hypothetical protein BDY19DRAFT_924044 [Irpex rosettiformis]